MRVASSARASTAKRGRRLEYFTIVWNTIEGLVAVIAGALAGSISLIGFGADSFIEVTSASALLWRMSVDNDAAKRERNERLALRVVGTCFIALAIYVVTESIRTILSRRAPERSPIGIAIAVASLIAMPLLSRAKRGRCRRATQRSYEGGFATDRFLRISVCNTTDWIGIEDFFETFAVGRRTPMN